MGARLTVLENRSSKEIEIKVWVHPARADHFQKIIKIEPGGMETVKPTAFSSKDMNLEEPGAGADAALFMIYVDGVWTGAVSSFHGRIISEGPKRRLCKFRRPSPPCRNNGCLSIVT